MGGILELVFDEDGNLDFRTSCKENDFFYDEIGSVLKIKQYRNERRELLESIETYYRIVFFGRRTRGGITDDFSTGRRKYKHNMRRV